MSAPQQAPVTSRLERQLVTVLFILTLILLSFIVIFWHRAPSQRTVEVTSIRSAGPGGLSSSTGPSRASDSGSSASTTTTPGAGDTTGSGSAGGRIIQLDDSVDSAKPFETVRIQGTYTGKTDILLRVQRLEGRKWLAFPIPAKTDQSGRFTVYVEFGQPGRYWIRVLDPDTRVTSKPFAVVVEG